MSKTILITGANRGLGLEFVRQYAEAGEIILACCRHPKEAKDLLELQRNHQKITIYQLDTASLSDIESLKEKITQPIDILINNAGMLEREASLKELSADTMNKCFMINTIAPLKITEVLLENIIKSNRKLVVSISSSMGSISENTSGGYYSYRASKAALNMTMKSAGFELIKYGVQVLLLHPGWVKTRMGGNDALIDPEVSITGMRRVIETYKPEPGEVRFYRFNGEIVPW